MQYEEIEDLFGLLFETISGQLSEKHLAQVRMFFDAGEYGIALETLLEALDESAVEQNSSMKSYIEKLKTIMEI